MQIKQFFYNPITAIFILVLCILFFFSLQATQNTSKKQYVKYQKQEAIVKQKEEELKKLEAEVKDLDDPFYQEKILRNELLLQKEGEKIIQLPMIPKTEEKPNPTPTPITVWGEWQQLLLK